MDKMVPGRARQGPVCEESFPTRSGVGLGAVEGVESGSTANAGTGRARQPDHNLILSSVRGYESCAIKVKRKFRFKSVRGRSFAEKYPSAKSSSSSTSVERPG